MRVTSILIIALCTAGFLFLGGAAEGSGQAPPFDLPLVGGGGRLASGAVFAEHRFVFLVFWESRCPHCVEALLDCEEFHREFGGDDVAVIGLNTDGNDALRIRSVLHANGITFPQLRDGSGEVARLYGIPLDVFAVVLVVDGTLAMRAEDPQGNVGAVMETMLAGTPSVAEPEQPPGADVAESGIVFAGGTRLRFLSVDSRGDAAVGPYGEEVSSRNDLLLRFELAASRRLGRYIMVGGLLRVSNEGDAVLRSGPQYFGSEWGSAFAELTVSRFTGRFGYYSIAMTPLTLMRWDWDDNPRTGGDAGCGCGAAAGVLLLQSLEELGPDLVFEGAIASYGLADFEARAFYAIPRRAVETTAMEVSFGGAEPTAYSFETYGADVRFQRHDQRTGSFWSAAVSFVGSWENPRSVDFKKLGYALAPPHYDSSILSLSARVPLVRWTSLTGEWIAANRSRGGEESGSDGRATAKGGGGTAGILFEHPRWLRLRCDYLSLDEDFSSPFAALSYEANGRGWRASSRLVLPGEFAALSLFYKNLRAIEVIEGRETVSFFGASVDLDLESGFGGSVGWLDRGNWTEENLSSPLDVARRAFTAGIRYRFEKNAYMQAQYQRVEGSGYEPVGIGEGTRSVESETHLFSLHCFAEF